jgi:hypothetical protein
MLKRLPTLGARAIVTEEARYIERLKREEPRDDVELFD